MHVDISRDTFDPASQFLRVIQEQGGVVLDADANEQTAILLHRLHQLATDVLGPHWGPLGEPGFEVKVKDKKLFTLSAGRYYVGGRMCQLLAKGKDIEYPLIPKDGNETDKRLVYLDVWERVVSVAERSLAAWPPARDPGLGDVPVAPRTKVVWKVRTKKSDKKLDDALKDLNDIKPTPDPVDADGLFKYLKAREKESEQRLSAQKAVSEAAVEANPKRDPTTAALAARSSLRVAVADRTGATEFPVGEPENQLYRVEVHRRGTASAFGTDGANQDLPTFKWSRDNGSAMFPISPKWLKAHAEKDKGWTFDDEGRVKVRLLAPPPADGPGLEEGKSIVEYCDPTTTDSPNELDVNDPRRLLLRVIKVEATDGPNPVATVTLERPPKDGQKSWPPVKPVVTAGERWAYLRRWDNQTNWKFDTQVEMPQKKVVSPRLAPDGAFFAAVRKTHDWVKPEETEWLDLDGVVQIRFQSGAVYEPGDFWLIPTRSATGNVIWKENNDHKDHLGQPAELPLTPAAEHFYAPLALVADGKVTDLRRVLNASRIEQLFVPLPAQ